MHSKLHKLYIELQKLPVDSPKSNFKTVIAKGDSGATKHYWRRKDRHVLEGMIKDASTTVTLPNSQGMQSTNKGMLPLSQQLSHQAKEAIVLPQLESSSLISLGQLCDDNCKVELDKNNLNACKEEKLVMKGCRNRSDGLWDMPITTPINLNNVKLPEMHPGMHKSRTCNRGSFKQRPHFRPKAKAVRKAIDAPREDIDSLIKEFTTRDNKINVILRKKQAKAPISNNIYFHQGNRKEQFRCMARAHSKLNKKALTKINACASRTSKCRAKRFAIHEI